MKCVIFRKVKRLDVYYKAFPGKHFVPEQEISAEI